MVAFENFFKSYYADLCNYAFGFLKEKTDAEEVVQDVFFTIWENRQKITIESSLKSYCYKSVRNKCLNIIKHIEIRETHKVHNEREILNTQNHTPMDYEQEELQQRINTAIEALPEIRQKVFKLSRYEGLKYKEIAEKLNISVKTVEVHMSKALSQLREALADYLPALLYLLHIFFDQQ